jgi:hypothetical protein
MKEETFPFFLIDIRKGGDYSKIVKMKEETFPFFLIDTCIRKGGIIPKLSK